MRSSVRFLRLLGITTLGLTLASSLDSRRTAGAADAPSAERCAPASKRTLVGFVVAVSGTAWAEHPECPSARRPLRCGEELREGDHVVTSTGGRAAFLAKDIYAQMDAESELRLNLTQDGAPDVALLRGYVRVIDQREDVDAPRSRIATPNAESLARGNDTEAAVLDADPKAMYSRLCEWAKPIVVTRIGRAEPTVAQPGECAVARPHVALYTTPGIESKVSLADTEQCDLGDVLGDSSDRFDPNNVALGTDVAGLSLLAPTLPPTPSCVSGAGQCGGTAPPRVSPPVLPPPPRPSVVESPPVFRPPPGLPVRPRPTP